MSALHQLRRSVSVENPNQALAQVGAGSRLSLSLVEAMPWRKPGGLTYKASESSEVASEKPRLLKAPHDSATR